MANQMQHSKATQIHKARLDEITHVLINGFVMSDLFAAAFCANSNVEMDWLWLAAQVTNHVEREYCLYKALYINPQSTAARRGLVTLRSIRSRAVEVNPARRQRRGFFRALHQSGSAG
jgi:hypothetical protein